MDQNWISVIHKAETPKYRVFAFCNAGAGVSIYLPWKSLAPSDVEFCAIQLPGREYRCEESFIVDMKLVVRGISDALVEYQDRPFGFFGHSLGALIAFETTRELRHRGSILPLALFLAGYTPPQHVVRPPIYQLEEEAFIEAIGKYYEPISPSSLAHKKFRDLYLSILKADTRLADTYHYLDEPPLDIPIFIFGGVDDPLAHEKGLSDWSLQSTKPVQIKMHPGSHFFINNAREEICQLMMQQLRALC